MDPAVLDFAGLGALEPSQEIVDPVEEQREEWFRQRRGKLTCSNFSKVMTYNRKKDDFSKTGISYLQRVAAERLGSYALSFSATSTNWGIDNEPIAIQEYESRFGPVQSGQFCFHSLTEDIGGTPDGLIGEDGCLEIKCPADPAVHLNTVITNQVPDEYVWQVVGHMLVTNRQWCDFVSFDPRMTVDQRFHRIRVERNGNQIETLRTRLDLAVERVNLFIRQATAAT